MPRASHFTLIDTFPRFLDFWKCASLFPISAQIAGWASDYLRPHRELLTKQARDYASQGIDWRRIAAQRVFPHITKRLPRMRCAHRNILAVAKPVWTQAQTALGFPLPLQVVIHVGIGCGAGWATTYNSRPAILLGLENIAEEEWSDRASIRGLLTHELGHLFLREIRRRHRKPIGRGPYWQLYDEGFASFCEQTIRSQPSSYRSRRPSSPNAEWPVTLKIGSVARRFLRVAQARRPVNRFFGSWLEIDGHSRLGYLLGLRILSRLAQDTSPLSVALLPDVNKTMRKKLQDIADLGA